MRFPVALALFSLPAVACTIDDIDVSVTDQYVIGGAAAPAGKWPDTVAVMWGTNPTQDQGCTGTLVAPNVVITAGHCVIGGAPTHVLVGATKLSAPQEGQLIPIMKAIEYPNSQGSVDAGVLVLQTPVTGIEPRPIASGWAKFDIQNNAMVQLVGFGTTDKNGSVSTDALMEATTIITDYNCTKEGVGCNTAARPDGEFGAGGSGIDTCPGDSGGPVYLTTSYGTYVMGITSRGYETNNYACSEGGIYERPDKIVDWLDMMSGAKVARGPSPVADPPTIMTIRGEGAETKIAHNDPKMGVTHKFEITKPPGFGKAAVRDDGTLRVCPNKDVAGDDIVEVTVSDTADTTRAITLKVPIVIADGSPPDSCDVNDFGGDGGGCCDTRRSAGGSIPLGLVVLLALRRRRK
ncbi:MAG TPA: trypsin-like serine protease [Kofleriaceae bacterium]|nr:trypsin-like serine protease [Kofleriaceae bacterium]